MTQKEKLMELIIDAKRTGPETGSFTEYLADYLLENGVIVPPVKVGDTVYALNRANMPQQMVFDTVDLRCTCEQEDYCMCGSLCCDAEHNICQHRFMNDFSDFGKTVFVTREEAERALKERGVGDA